MLVSNEPLFQKTTLENGIRVITEKMPGTRSASMGILVEAGPAQEAPEKSGLAHLTEHMLFQGTSSRDARGIARQMDIGGGLMGGFTSRDYTCYTATVLDEYIPYALDLFGDLLLNSIFPLENLANEKDAILSEIGASLDHPGMRAHDLLKAKVWSGHSLGRPIAGSPATVKDLTREDLIYFIHQYYLPDRMIVAAAGNLEHDDFVAQVRDGFWRMLGQAERRAPAEIRFTPGVTVENRPVSQAYFSIGLRALPYAHSDRYFIHVLNTILGGGASSRLYRKLREEKGLVYDIGSEFHSYRDDGLLVIEGSTLPEYLMSVLTAVLGEIWMLGCNDAPVDEDELWKAKMQIRGQHLIAAENSSTIMSRLATQEFYFGGYLPSKDILKEIDDIHVENLAAFCENRLCSMFSQSAISVVGPESDKWFDQGSIEKLHETFASIH